MEQLSKDHIRSLALANGFSLKKQPDDSMDLNPYVYDFAAKVAEHGARIHFIAGIQKLSVLTGQRVTAAAIAALSEEYLSGVALADCACTNAIEQQTGDGIAVLFCLDCGQSKAGGAQ